MRRIDNRREGDVIKLHPFSETYKSITDRTKWGYAMLIKKAFGNISPQALLALRADLLVENSDMLYIERDGAHYRPSEKVLSEFGIGVSSDTPIYTNFSDGSHIDINSKAIWDPTTESITTFFNRELSKMSPSASHASVFRSIVDFCSSQIRDITIISYTINYNGSTKRGVECYMRLGENMYCTFGRFQTRSGGQLMSISKVIAITHPKVPDVSKLTSGKINIDISKRLTTSLITTKGLMDRTFQSPTFIPYISENNPFSNLNETSVKIDNIEDFEEMI